MNPQQLSFLLFPVLFGMVAVWFVLLKRLFSRLERRHPEKYEAMGRPSLFLRNSIAGGLATLRFLVGREHKALDDSALSRLSDAALVFFVIYPPLFLVLTFAVAGQFAAA